jgi:hypothetical protein
MITARIKGDDVIKMLKNSVKYSSAFNAELNKNKDILNRKVGQDSIDVFYDYLDGLARSHPGMLHHVYEWGNVGNPTERLFELTMAVNKSSAVISADFLQSRTPSPTSLPARCYRTPPSTSSSSATPIRIHLAESSAKPGMGRRYS